MQEKTKIYWEKVGLDYSNSWLSSSKKEMSLKESGFISKYIGLKNPKRSLDIGVGNGRILENHIEKNIPIIYGIDMSKKMVQICLKKFKQIHNIKDIKVCDLSKEDIPFSNRFEFISAIRVLKYNPNWKEIILKIKSRLVEGGIFVFTMPNKRSINGLLKLDIEYNRTEVKEIKKIIKENGLELLEIKSFTRIPDVFYDLLDNHYYTKILMGIESFLGRLLGKTFLGRILFLAVKKPENVEDKK